MALSQPKPLSLAPRLTTRDCSNVSDQLTIWQISDGKPGHENQSLGLIDALGRACPCESFRIDVSEAGNFWTRWRTALAQAKPLPMANLIIGAGHATHFPMWCLKRVSGAKSVVLMKPSLPMGFFDLCLAPRHDFPAGATDEDGLILTEGAINRVLLPEGERGGKLILIGGPSKTHGWDEDAMMKSLDELVADGEWKLTDSRRTPEGFLDRVRTKFPQVDVHPHHETDSKWLPRELRYAEEVWVSEDSVSMTYEAISSGARVGLLPVPRLREDSRVLRGLERMLEQGRLSTLEQWHEAGRQLSEAKPLREADRCARLLLERLEP